LSEVVDDDGKKAQTFNISTRSGGGGQNEQTSNSSSSTFSAQEQQQNVQPILSSSKYLINS
jgi:hypothetical protein